MESCFSGDGWTPVSPWEAVDEFHVLLCERVCMAFAFTIKLSLSQSLSFLAFTLPFHSKLLEWGSHCVVLGCWLRLSHDKEREIEMKPKRNKLCKIQLLTIHWTMTSLSPCSDHQLPDKFPQFIYWASHREMEYPHAQLESATQLWFFQLLLLIVAGRQGEDTEKSLT